MNCAQHPELPATAYCRECGKPMCQECQRPALGSVYCDAHVPVSTPPGSPSAETMPLPYTAPAPSPYTVPHAAIVTPQPDESAHPVLALILGLIPGVGAIYNGQYAKGIVHALVFGLLVSTIANAHNDGMAALLGIMIAAWVFYMAFEAYHTARKRRYGVALEEFPGQFDFRMGRGRVPTGAILLIGLGFILLLDTTDIVPLEDFQRYWPVGLIALGAWLLYSRLHPVSAEDAGDSRAKAER